MRPSLKLLVVLANLLLVSPGSKSWCGWSRQQRSNQFALRFGVGGDIPVSGIPTTFVTSGLQVVGAGPFDAP